MAEQSTDPVRDLMRRAYNMDDDVEDDLRDVVSRAALPRDEVRIPAPRRRPRILAVVATFAAAIVTIFAAATAAGHLGGHRSPPAAAQISAGPSPAVVDSPSFTPADPHPDRSDPVMLPSPCPGAWDLALTGTTFTVSDGSDGSCPPLPVARLWLIDEATGNGAINPGDATIWPITPVGTDAAALTAPFGFTVQGGWPGPVHGHLYSVWFLSVAESRTATPGADANLNYQDAYGISRTAKAS